MAYVMHKFGFLVKYLKQFVNRHPKQLLISTKLKFSTDIQPTVRECDQKFRRFVLKVAKLFGMVRGNNS